MAKVLFEHVSKQFDATVAVSDLTLEVEDEEFLVLVGPSGCGKTTALRMIAGLEEPTSGSIFIGDRLVNGVAPRDRDIAMVFQSYALYPHMTVYDNMAFGLKLHHVRKDEIARRVDDAAKTLGIETLLKRKPRQLSGGQRQRVALGRAIVREPVAFLMDEPLSNLDAKLRVETRAQITKLHQRLRTTTVYVTHDQVEAMTMGDRIAVMRDGVLQQLDTPQGVYDRPSNLFVAGFIGSPAMNMLRMQVVSDGLDVSLVAGGVTLPAPGHLKDLLRSRHGGEVVIGIRPEDLREESPSGQEMAVLTARVEVVEPLGSDAYLNITTGDFNLVARVNGRTLARPGDVASLGVDLQHVHAFDPQSESNLMLETPAAVA
jgi:multiple sugar transport system ATP-binding protein